MNDIRQQWRQAVLEAIIHAASAKSLDAGAIALDQIIVETPPNPEFGDLAFPMFPFARIFRTSPAAVASLVTKRLLEPDFDVSGTANAEGPYVNVLLDRPGVAAGILKNVETEGDGYGRGISLTGKKIMVEFSCPNTNKPLHLGHLRNDAIGESVANILDSCGAVVKKVNLVNDRGIHICKSMLAYQRFGEGKTPESEGIKSDHFVGDYYVRYNTWESEDRAAEEAARDLLRKWEAGDSDTTSLWKTMNGWTMSGIEETYKRTGISFDSYYYESETYTSGRDQVTAGLEKKVFYKEEDGSVWIDLTDEGLDKKILLRSDGTSVYVTQDIGTAIHRHEDWPFDQLIYVVGAEQEYHFKVLFHVLRSLGYAWAEDLYHFSYGMVNLPDGKMKSREGTVVDADDLIDMLSDLAKKEIVAKDRTDEVDDLDLTAEYIARAAINYYLLQVSPGKDMIFDPAESIAFNGNTGPYLQYTGARLSSMIRKFEERADEFSAGSFDPNLISSGDEWEVIKFVGEYPSVVESAGKELNPTALAIHLYNLAKTYSRYYHDNPVLHNTDPSLVQTRITVAKCVIQVLQNGFRLLGIPFLHKM
jgi:arginyl-tRNA synthetase